ncbi:MAG: phytanoyl-CoA dioxygenase family protein [Planctomycetota bacterium]|nr:phytanoyl-CoA dioxygenase family protein [Planctomycetota bacterium]
MSATALQATEKLVEHIEPVGTFRDTDPRAESPETLRARLAEEGYLFVRGLMNLDGLLELRCQILELCREHGWLAPGAPLMDGVYSGIPFPAHNTEYMALYRKLQKLDLFNDFARSREIMDFFATLLQGEILCHPRTIARVSFPRNYGFTTQPHQDFFYIRGAAETYTAWIPVGDCPRELGGLALLEGSHKHGFLPHEKAIGAGGNGVRTGKMGLRWLASDFRAGDAIVFHSHTIHGALENHTPDRLRLSLDYRYQLAKDDVDPSSLKPHGG